GGRFAGRRQSVDIDAELRGESNPDKYDSDRNPVSWEVEAGMDYPGLTLYPTLTLGPSLGLAWMKNSQQLEEFERLAYLGPSMRWRISRGVYAHGIAAAACNEHEKDDERPRQQLNLGREVLNRRGCGSYAAIHTDYLTLRRWRLSVDVTRYQGDYGERNYRRSLAIFDASYSFNRADRCPVQLQVIHRNADIDLLGTKDQVQRLAFECRRQYRGVPFRKYGLRVT
ncbi:MAG: hypothetical protein HUJ31_14290, partial [Pseudomonadales bacterium]|nr:hypothetical protein [Pseudomonadales bacterium]